MLKTLCGHPGREGHISLPVEKVCVGLLRDLLIILKSKLNLSGDKAFLVHFKFWVGDFSVEVKLKDCLVSALQVQIFVLEVRKNAEPVEIVEVTLKLLGSRVGV